MNNREGLNYSIERKEMDRLSKAHPDLRREAIRDVFHAGFGFGFCEGLGAAKRAIQKTIDEGKVGGKP